MYDLCVISFSSLKHDGRSLNIIRTLSQKYSIAIISLTSNDDFSSLGLTNSEHFHIYLPARQRHIIRWQKFTQQAKFILKEIDCSRIFAADLYSLMPAVFSNQKSKAKIIYDSREIYSALGPLSQSFIKQFILAKIEKYLVQKVDKIVVSGQLDADYLRSYFQTSAPIEVILNVPPFQDIVESNLIKEKYPFLANKTVLIYQGAVLPGRGLMPALDIIAADKQLALAVLGDGYYHSEVKAYAQAKGLLDRVAFCGNVDYAELHRWTCSADIGLCIIEPISFSYELALPNKMFEYIMAGIPQIVSNLPAMKQIVDKHKIGELIQSDSSPEEIIDIINSIEQNRQEYIDNCKETAKIFCYESQEKVIFELF